MATGEVQTTIGRLLGFGLAFTSVFLLNSGVSDPVNVTKMTAAGGVGIAALLLFLVFGLKTSLKSFPSTLITVALFLLSGINAVVFSESPLSQNLYGTYGRNTGFLTYLFMVGIFLCALMIENERQFIYLVYGLILTGVINVVYCAWVLSFGDFLSWSNPYGNILGLFGNPDFISAFLGMFITSSVALIFSDRFKLWQKLSLILLGLIAFYEILKSHAIQGIVVTVGGLTIIGFYLIYSKFAGFIASGLYISLVGLVGVLAVLGTLQKGPLTFVYKRSVSLRGSYWHAGMDMGMQNPFNGIGFDTYGDWYRRSRPPVALVDMPGVNIMSNVSHNVVIDFFASGGWPLLLSYVALLFLGLRSIVRVTIKNRKYDSIFVALAATWMCYQAQSFISINQVGLTVWGWALTGALIAYEKFKLSASNELTESTNRPKRQAKKSTSPISPALVAFIGAAIGIFVAAPALNAETTWHSANQSRNLENIKRALEPSVMNPASSFKYAQAVDLFQRSNLLDLAHTYAVIGTRFNPDYFDGWKQFYYLPNASDVEKNEALNNMKRLDPLNPDVTQIR